MDDTPKDIVDEARYLIRHLPDDQVDERLREAVAKLALVRDRIDGALAIISQTSGTDALDAQLLAETVAVASTLETRVNSRWRLQKARREEKEDLDRQADELEQERQQLELREAAIDSEEISVEQLAADLDKRTEPLERDWNKEADKQDKAARSEEVPKDE